MRTQILYHGKGILHLKVWKEDGSDGITWDELMAVKNEFLGEEVEAIEIYPPQNEVVNDANIRHLWVVPNLFLPSLYFRNYGK